MTYSKNNLEIALNDNLYLQQEMVYLGRINPEPLGWTRQLTGPLLKLSRVCLEYNFDPFLGRDVNNSSSWDPG